MNIIHLVVGLPDIGRDFLINKQVCSSNCFVYNKATYITGLEHAMHYSKTYAEIEQQHGNAAIDTLNSLLYSAVQNNSTVIWDEYTHTASGRAYIISKAKEFGYLTHCHSLIVNSDARWKALVSSNVRGQDFTQSFISDYIKPSMSEGFDFITEYDL